MTGPEHYLAAEELIQRAEQNHASKSSIRQACLDRAQVHATLAHAAATAMHHPNSMDMDDFEAWYEVCGA